MGDAPDWFESTRRNARSVQTTIVWIFWDLGAVTRFADLGIRKDFAGPLGTATTGFPGDRRAARGFNGDIGRHLARWRDADDTTDPAELGRRIARKTLLAAAGLVSIHDGGDLTGAEATRRRIVPSAPIRHPRVVRVKRLVRFS